MDIGISYNTPIKPCDETYFGTPNVSTTQLPTTTTLIRAVAIKAIAAYICLTTITWCWPVLLISSAFAGWTIYSNMLRPDPLVETLYQIVGGKQKFEALPTLDLSKSEKSLTETIKTLDWDKLDKQVYRSQTTDGRQVMIVKALSKEIKQNFIANCQTKSLFAFVEKLGSYDYSHKVSDLFLSLIDALSFKGNTAGTTMSSGSYASTNSTGKEIKESYKYIAFSSISNELANEIREQLR